MSAEPNEATGRSGTVTFFLGFEPGTKTRYRVTTEAVTVVEHQETAAQGNASTAASPKLSESSDVVFTQEILGPAPGDTNAVAALVTIERVRYARTLPGQPDLAFDSGKPADQNSPFAKLVGQVYTIEIHPLGYTAGVFNLSSPRLAVRGDTPAHAAALNLVSPPAVFLRHGCFHLPGPDLGALAVGGRWRGLQQFTLEAPGTGLGRLGTYKFEKIYRLEAVDQRPAGTIAEVTFAGSPIPKGAPNGNGAQVPFLSYFYAGGGEFNLDAGRIEEYLEHLEVRIPPAKTASPPAASADADLVVAIRSCRVQRLDLE